MKMQLLQVQDRNQWQAYHAIRRHVLFELRGQAGYDEDHPDEHRENHLPLLFIYDDVPVGTVRLDIALVGGAPATVRLVAIIPQYQRQGIGRAMESESASVAPRLSLRSDPFISVCSISMSSCLKCRSGAGYEFKPT